jgi:hypothetical protein
MKKLAGVFLVAAGLALGAIDLHTRAQGVESYQKQFPSLSETDASKVRSLERSHLSSEGIVDFMLLTTGLTLITRKPSPN